MHPELLGGTHSALHSSHIATPCFLAAALWVLAGCGQGAALQRETDRGGIAAFSIESEHDIFSSAGRREALRLIDGKCPAGAKIVKEGELPKVSNAVDRAWGPQIGTDRKWGIQFECK